MHCQISKLISLSRPPSLPHHSRPRSWAFIPTRSASPWRSSKTSLASSRATALCRTLTLSTTTATWQLSGSAWPFHCFCLFPTPILTPIPDMTSPNCVPLYTGWLVDGRSGIAPLSRMPTQSAMGCFPCGDRTCPNRHSLHV